MKKVLLVVCIVIIAVILGGIFYKTTTTSPNTGKIKTTIEQENDVSIDYGVTDITGIVVEDSGPKEQSINTGTPIPQDRSN
jgi:hypothetical protein